MYRWISTPIFGYLSIIRLPLATGTALLLCCLRHDLYLLHCLRLLHEAASTRSSFQQGYRASSARCRLLCTRIIKNASPLLRRLLHRRPPSAESRPQRRRGRSRGDTGGVVAPASRSTPSTSAEPWIAGVKEASEAGKSRRCSLTEASMTLTKNGVPVRCSAESDASVAIQIYRKTRIRIRARLTISFDQTVKKEHCHSNHNWEE